MRPSDCDCGTAALRSSAISRHWKRSDVSTTRPCGLIIRIAASLAAVVALFVVVAFVLFATDGLSRPLERSESAATAPLVRSTVSSAVDTFERSPPEPSSRADRLDWEDVYRSCHGLAEPLADRLSVRGGFTPSCETALDRLLLDQPPIGVPLAATDGSLVWRRVFSSPIQSREKAEQAMSRSCDEMERDCDLDALASYAILKYQCGGRRYAMRRHIRPGLHQVVERAGLDDLADNTLYWQRRTEVERAYYRAAWLAAKCDDLTHGVLASFVPEGHTSAFPGDARLPPRIYNVTRTAHDPGPGEEGWWWAEQAWEAYRLMSRAYAVDRRTAGRYGPIHYEYGNLVRDSWQSQDPLLAEIVQLKRWGRPIEWSEGRSRRLDHAYLATIYAAGQGFVIDRNWLSAQIGPPVVSEEEWDEAARRAERLLHAQGRRVLFVDHLRDDS